ncbi:hypothetical protein L7F22_040791 [Adiantum nelumboides]|nr:hypothetical protein [Adiantum nelumboides]
MENEDTSGLDEQIEGLMQPKVLPNVKEELIQKMLSPDLTNHEKGEYLHMLQQFPKLFITSYEEIKGFKGEEINFTIKEGAQPVRQKLRRMGQEYATLEKGLQLCLELGIQRVKVKGDALLVVKKVLGMWQSNNSRLKNMCFHVKNLLKLFEAWSLRHIDRSHNEEAHAVAQAMIGQLYVIRADSPLYLGRETL